MKMNRLGRTDILVSEICLGTMTWGSQNTREEAYQQMDYALEPWRELLRHGRTLIRRRRFPQRPMRITER